MDNISKQALLTVDDLTEHARRRAAGKRQGAEDGAAEAGGTVPSRSPSPAPPPSSPDHPSEAEQRIGGQSNEP